MFQAIANLFKVQELRKKLLFTIGMLVLFRLGASIPIPGINYSVLMQLISRGGGAGGLQWFFDLFSGGALHRLSLFALGVMPYISSLIIIELLIYVIPSLERLSREGPEGQRKIIMYARIGTIPIALIEAIGLIFTYLNNLNIRAVQMLGQYIFTPTPWFYINVVITVIAGTIFLMWIGEQITERGIGNGVSLIIASGIISRIPYALYEAYRSFTAGSLTEPINLLIILVVFVLLIMFVVWFEQAQRKIPVHYAKRVVGRRVYGGGVTYLPLKLNPAGVIAIIFAFSVLIFPSSIINMVGLANTQWGRTITYWLSYNSPVYMLIYILLIIFFSYFYTFIQFDPVRIADELKKYAGFIPGIRPGQQTVEYLTRILNRLLLPGSLFVGVIAIAPDIIYNYFHLGGLAGLMGGTSLLIMVGVTIDTLTQIDSLLVMHRLPGLLGKARIRGRGVRYV